MAQEYYVFDRYEIMIRCWKRDPQHRPNIRSVRAMLDELLDTGEYISLTDTETAISLGRRHSDHLLNHDNNNVCSGHHHHHHHQSVPHRVGHQVLQQQPITHGSL